MGGVAYVDCAGCVAATVRHLKAPAVGLRNQCCAIHCAHFAGAGLPILFSALQAYRRHAGRSWLGTGKHGGGREQYQGHRPQGCLGQGATLLSSMWQTDGSSCQHVSANASHDALLRFLYGSSRWWTRGSKTTRSLQVWASSKANGSSAAVLPLVCCTLPGLRAASFAAFLPALQCVAVPPRVPCRVQAPPMPLPECWPSCGGMGHGIRQTAQVVFSCLQPSILFWSGH